MKDTGYLLASIDFSHCLRPEFTRNIVQGLIRDRQSINVIGEKGTGKTRLLEDIRKCDVPGTKIIDVDLKSHIYNFSGFLREIHKQLGMKGKVPDKLDRLFEGLERKAGYYLIFLKNYDALLDNAKLDAGYNKNFFDDLNSIRNKENVSIVCPTCIPHKAAPIIIAGETYTSWITLKEIPLPELTRLQITDELNRQPEGVIGQWIKAHPSDKDRLVDCIHLQSLPYSRLDFFAGKLRDQTDEEDKLKFKKRLKKWLKKFKKLNKKRLDRKLHGAKLTVLGALVSSGLNKVKIPFISIIDLIKSLRKEKSK